jgi:hypothetical protein
MAIRRAAHSQPVIFSSFGVGVIHGLAIEFTSQDSAINLLSTTLPTNPNYSKC